MDTADRAGVPRARVDCAATGAVRHAPAHLKETAASDGPDGLRLRTLLPLGDLELDPLALFE
ncbi:hypothetical protein GCM10027187_69790 [Streptosporangium sandarakinum]